MQFAFTLSLCARVLLFFILLFFNENGECLCYTAVDDVPIVGLRNLCISFPAIRLSWVVKRYIRIIGLMGINSGTFDMNKYLYLLLSWLGHSRLPHRIKYLDSYWIHIRFISDSWMQRIDLWMLETNRVCVVFISKFHSCCMQTPLELMRQLIHTSNNDLFEMIFLCKTNRQVSSNHRITNIPFVNYNNSLNVFSQSIDEWSC